MSVRTRLLLSAAQIAVAFATIPALGQTAQPPSPPPPAEGPPPAARARLEDRFAAANTTHDGRLTLAQAQAARMSAVARNFAAIDAQNKGFVTIDDIRAYHREQRAAHAVPSTAGAPQ